MNTPLWYLRVLERNGECCTILCTEVEARSQQNAWREWHEQPDTGARHALEFVGQTDCGARAPISIVMDPESISAVLIWRQ